MIEAGLPELDLARVRRWCQQRVPEHARSQVKVEYDVAPRHLTIVECRAPWRADAYAEWTRFPIARLRYTKGNQAVVGDHHVLTLRRPAQPVNLVRPDA